MPPPSQLAIATSSVLRLVKEEASYHTELSQQEARIKKLQSAKGDENAEFTIRQEIRAVGETKAVFPSLRQRIGDAVVRLENQLEAEKESGKETPLEEITKAKEAVAQAKASYREVA
ncbi:MAG: hypothetical protein M1827_004878 [Pycnora praestabilis]|nr:MAG: hypothetical protein M1827_004878 [Pycnora praestabilis]